MEIDFDFSKYWKIKYLYFPDHGSAVRLTPLRLEAAPEFSVRAGSAHPNFRNIEVQHYRRRNHWTREGSSLPWIRSLEAWAGKTESIVLKDRLQQSNKKTNKQFFLSRKDWKFSSFRRPSLSQILSYVYAYADYQHKEWVYEQNSVTSFFSH
jgi:hypothetical protein